MNLQECINFITEIKLCNLATVEGDQPRVRTLGLWFADETGFYFQSSNKKKFPHQLKKNPKTEVCFSKTDAFRISGVVEIMNDVKLKERAINDRPFLKSIGLDIYSPDLFIFRIAHGEINYYPKDGGVWNLKETIKF